MREITAFYEMVDSNRSCSVAVFEGGAINQSIIRTAKTHLYHRCKNIVIFPIG